MAKKHKHWGHVKSHKRRTNPSLTTALSHPVDKLKRGVEGALPIAVGAVANFKLNQLADAAIARNFPSVAGTAQSVLTGGTLGLAALAVPKYGVPAFQGAMIFQTLRLLSFVPMLAVKIGEALTGEDMGSRSMGEALEAGMGEALGVDSLAPDMREMFASGQAVID